MFFLRYILLFVFFSFISFSLQAKEGKSIIAYTEIYGPMESYIAPNFELVIFDEFKGLFTNNSFMLRAGISLIELDFFIRYQRYLAGLHYTIGEDHKLDIGVNYLYQKFEENYIFKTDNFLSLNIGYRNYYESGVLIGFALNPTFSKRNKPFWPASLKIGVVLY